MYIDLFPKKQLKQCIRAMMMLGLLLVTGGAYALFREAFLSETFRLAWAISSAVVFTAGLVCVFLANNRLLLKEAYFSMNPESIKYRLAVFVRERVIYWKDVQGLSISAHTIVYKLNCGSSIKMRLGYIQKPEVMLHVSRSIHLAAMEKGIIINNISTAVSNTVA